MSAARCAKIFLALSLSTAGCATPNAQNSCKRLIGWPEEGAQGNPSNLIAKWDHVETLPFDGHVIFLPQLQFHDVMTPGSAMTYQQIYVDSRLAELALKFKRVKHNYLMAWCNKAEFFDNAIWPTIIQNFANLAKAAKAAGIAGIVFDNEQYLQKVWDYPLAVNHAATYTIDQYRAQVRLRGKQVMAAMIAEFPDIEVLTSHGPYWSEPKYNLTPNPIYLDGELAGSFFLGFEEAVIDANAAGHSPKVIDGGELYRPRTIKEFEDSYQWRKHFIASSGNNSPTIPVAQRAAWPNNTSISFGVFNIGNEAPMDANIMRATMEMATRRVDDVVWLYFTKQQDWYTAGVVGNDWLTAVRDGFMGGLDGKGCKPN